MVYSPDDILIASDYHFSHSNILKYTNRGNVFANIDEMNEGLIKNWNKKVKPGNTVMFLGDFAFASKEKIRYIVSRLNGNIILIKGNHDHDKHSNVPLDVFAEVHQYLEFYIGDQGIVAFHYPIESWNRMSKGSWHLHGHCHGSLQVNKGLKRMDVGIDCHPNYEPFSFNEIKQYMDTIKFNPVDHHGKR